MSELLISVTELAGVLDTPKLRIVDVRHELFDPDAGFAAYQSGHVPGAIFWDYERQLCGKKTGGNGRHPLPDLAKFSDFLLKQGINSDTSVVVYDAGNSAFAARVWWMLRWAGHTKVQVLDGGWQAWLAAGGPAATGGPVPVPASSAANRGAQSIAAMPVLEAKGILANLQHPAFVVVDARDSARFRGDTEPIDPVAGHIPGAINRPIALNLQPDGRFKSPDTLRQEYTALLQGRASDEIVHQCGSAITACHNLFAMELAGLSGSALYPGSWSEWCSDPSRPVAVGP